MKSVLKIFLFFLFVLPSFSYAGAAAIGKGGSNAIKLDIGGTTQISDPKYSVQEESSGLCKYVDDTQGTGKALEINKDIFNTDNILMGLADPANCPTPGTKFLPDGYPDALAGEFILSGVICVVQSIILDSMFRVYCTVLLWFYQILIALMIIYIMFYGLAIVFGLSDDPLKEAPKKLIFIIFIFTFVVNAEIGFKWVFQTFNTFLDTFSNILTRIQPIYDEDGRRVYDEDGHLLAENGEIWQPLATGTDYVMVNEWTANDGTPEVSEFTGKIGQSSSVNNDTLFPKVPTSMPIKNGTFTFTPITNPIRYSPFRVPAQQWQSKLEGTVPNKQFKVYPVYRQFNSDLNGNVYFLDDTTFCSGDFIYNHQKKRLELYPRCHQKDWATIPEFAPYAMMINKNLNPQGEESIYSAVGIYTKGTILKPEKLLDESNNLSTPCDEAGAPETCRQPFQGILGKVDALFDSVLGDDNAKSLASLAAALALWGLGGGTVLSMFLMTGVLTMFTAFVQIIWVYVTALMGLTFLMMLAPVFIAFKLFKITEPMFKVWVSMIVSFMWQPIIVLGIVYVLSNATTLDRLGMLAKNEVGPKRYETSGGAGENKGEFTAPGFLEPAYQMPPDYGDVRNVGADELAQISNKEDTLISRIQREQYREEKGEFLLASYLCQLAGIVVIDRTKPDRIAALNTSQKARDFLAAYENPTTFPPVAGATDQKTIITTGVDTINEYATRNTLPPNTQLTNADMDGFIDLYNEQLGVDDKDAFRGEPASPVVNNTFVPLGEFPNCVKNCPSFDPPYDINDLTTVNPTKDQCVAFCLYIHENEKDMFGYIAGGVILWIIINAMTGAFMAKVPVLAAELSKIYDVKSPVIYGSAATAGAKGWATGISSGQFDEKGAFDPDRGIYNMGNLLDLGLISGRPGTLARMADRMQQMANRRKIADGQGGLTTEDGKSIYDWMGVFGMKNPEQQRREQIATKSREAYFKILQENGTQFDGLKEYVKDYKKGGKNQEAIEKDISEIAQKMPNASERDIKNEYLKVLNERKAKAEKEAQQQKASGGFISKPNQQSDVEGLASVGQPASRTSITYDPQQLKETFDLQTAATYKMYQKDTDTWENARLTEQGKKDLEERLKQQGNVVTPTTVNAATAVSAVGVAAIGKNIKQLAKYLDPATGKLNEKYRKQFEDQLRQISPTIPAEAAVSIIEKEWQRLGSENRDIIIKEQALPSQQPSQVAAIKIPDKAKENIKKLVQTFDPNKNPNLNKELRDKIIKDLAQKNGVSEDILKAEFNKELASRKDLGGSLAYDIPIQPAEISGNVQVISEKEKTEIEKASEAFERDEKPEKAYAESITGIPASVMPPAQVKLNVAVAKAVIKKVPTSIREQKKQEIIANLKAKGLSREVAENIYNIAQKETEDEIRKGNLASRTALVESGVIAKELAATQNNEINPDQPSPLPTELPTDIPTELPTDMPQIQSVPVTADVINEQKEVELANSEQQKDKDYDTPSPTRSEQEIKSEQLGKRIDISDVKPVISQVTTPVQPLVQKKPVVTVNQKIKPEEKEPNQKVQEYIDNKLGKSKEATGEIKTTSRGISTSQINTTNIQINAEITESGQQNNKINPDQPSPLPTELPIDIPQIQSAPIIADAVNEQKEASQDNIPRETELSIIEQQEDKQLGESIDLAVTAPVVQQVAVVANNMQQAPVQQKPLVTPNQQAKPKEEPDLQSQKLKEYLDDKLARTSGENKKEKVEVTSRNVGAAGINNLTNQVVAENANVEVKYNTNDQKNPNQGNIDSAELPTYAPENLGNPIKFTDTQPISEQINVQADIIPQIKEADNIKAPTGQQYTESSVSIAQPANTQTTMPQQSNSFTVNQPQIIKPADNNTLPPNIQSYVNKKNNDDKPVEQTASTSSNLRSNITGLSMNTAMGLENSATPVINKAPPERIVTETVNVKTVQNVDDIHAPDAVFASNNDSPDILVNTAPNQASATVEDDVSYNTNEVLARDNTDEKIPSPTVSELSENKLPTYASDLNQLKEEPVVAEKIVTSPSTPAAEQAKVKIAAPSKKSDNEPDHEKLDNQLSTQASDNKIQDELHSETSTDPTSQPQYYQELPKDPNEEIKSIYENVQTSQHKDNTEINLEAPIYSSNKPETIKIENIIGGLKIKNTEEKIEEQQAHLNEKQSEELEKKRQLENKRNAAIMALLSKISIHSNIPNAMIGSAVDLAIEKLMSGSEGEIDIEKIVSEAKQFISKEGKSEVAYSGKKQKGKKSEELVDISGKYASIDVSDKSLDLSKKHISVNQKEKKSEKDVAVELAKKGLKLAQGLRKKVAVKGSKKDDKKDA